MSRLSRPIARLRRQLTYQGQRLALFLQRQVPGVARQLLKYLYRNLLRLLRPRHPAAQLQRAETNAKYTVVCFSIIDWRWRIQRPQHLLTAFANNGHRIYYLRTDFEPGFAPAPLEPLAGNVFGLRLPGPANLDISTAPFPETLLERWLAALDELRQTQRLNEVICLVQQPFWSPLAWAARRRWGWRVVYDCLDELTGFSSSHPALQEQESGLIAESDLVLTTARVLYERCAPLARRCIRLPNAADFQHFQHPGGRAVLADLIGPVIGYFGAVSEWFEPELVRAAARAHPEWNFVLIGLDPGTRLSVLERMPNVHLLGEMPYGVLPDYLHRFDAVIIPFKLNALTRATNPVKFYEYLSAGKPVVAVALPELEPYRDLFYRAATAEEFVSQLEAAIAERDPAKTAARVQVAQANLWTHRFYLLDREVRRLYPPVTVVVAGTFPLAEVRRCLESVWSRTDYPNFDLIVAGGDSDPEVLAYLQACQEAGRTLTVLPGSAQAGLAPAANRAVAAAQGEYVALLSGDTVVLHGWLSKLVRHLENDPEAALIGPQIDWADGSVPQPGKAEADWLGEIEQYAERNVLAPAGISHEVRAVELACAVVRRSAFEAVGPLDEGLADRLALGADYCLRLRRAGYRALRAEDVGVYVPGWEAAGWAALPGSNGGLERDQKYLEEKWGQRWRKPGPREGLAPAVPG